MKRAVVSPVGVLALVLFAGAAIGDHVELPQDLQKGLPQLPDGSTAQPAGDEADVHSDNILLVTSFDDHGQYRQGTDLAFWGNLAVAGNYGSPGGGRPSPVLPRSHFAPESGSSGRPPPSSEGR